MKLLGSHNSLSYLRPKKWYMYPFIFTAKCQKVNYKEQYKNYNIRVFDLRVWFDKDGNLEVRHGAMVYNIDLNGVYEFLHYLNSKTDSYVRIILEEDNLSKREKNSAWKEILFDKFCTSIETLFTNVYFFGGRRKYDWLRIHDFKHDDIPLLDLYSSTTRFFGKAIFKKGVNMILNMADDWYPWLYAKFHNKKNYQEYINNDKEECLMCDFINIR